MAHHYKNVTSQTLKPLQRIYHEKSMWSIVTYQVRNPSTAQSQHLMITKTQYQQHITPAMQIRVIREKMRLMMNDTPGIKQR